MIYPLPQWIEQCGFLEIKLLMEIQMLTCNLSKMWKSWISGLLAILCLVACSADAKPVTKLWRIDRRSPDQIIFSKLGFKSWGTNANVRDHISGHSCVELAEDVRDSAFISLSADYEWAKKYAITRALLSPGLPIYLYAVRPDSHFYEAERSLKYYASLMPDEIIPDFAYQPARIASEYLAHRWIPSENILKAEVYVVKNEVLTSPMIILNPNYVARFTQASRLAFKELQQASRSIFTWVRHFPEFVGACISDLGQVAEADLLRSRTSLANNDAAVNDDLPYTLEALVTVYGVR